MDRSRSATCQSVTRIQIPRDVRPWMFNARTLAGLPPTSPGRRWTNLDFMFVCSQQRKDLPRVTYVNPSRDSDNPACMDNEQENQWVRFMACESRTSGRRRSGALIIFCRLIRSHPPVVAGAIWRVCGSNHLHPRPPEDFQANGPLDIHRWR